MQSTVQHEHLPRNVETATIPYADTLVRVLQVIRVSPWGAEAHITFTRNVATYQIDVQAILLVIDHFLGTPFKQLVPLLPQPILDDGRVRMMHWQEQDIALSVTLHDPHRRYDAMVNETHAYSAVHSMCVTQQCSIPTSLKDELAHVTFSEPVPISLLQECQAEKH